jgi:hypothetical protein
MLAETGVEALSADAGWPHSRRKSNRQYWTLLAIRPMTPAFKIASYVPHVFLVSCCAEQAQDYETIVMGESPTPYSTPIADWVATGKPHHASSAERENLCMVDLCGAEAEHRGRQLFMQRNASIPGIKEGMHFRNTYAWEQLYSRAKMPQY